MIKLFILLSLIILIGCSNSVRDNTVGGKFCIQECTDHEFQKFHGEGHSWGKGSSSMNGLSQDQIYKTVIDYCTDFYTDVKCCANRIDSNDEKFRIEYVHGFSYGQCRE